MLCTRSPAGKRAAYAPLCPCCPFSRLQRKFVSRKCCSLLPLHPTKAFREPLAVDSLSFFRGQGVESGDAVWAGLARLGTTTGSGCTRSGMDLLYVCVALGIVSRRRVGSLVESLGHLPLHMSLVFCPKGIEKALVNPGFSFQEFANAQGYDHRDMSQVRWDVAGATCVVSRSSPLLPRPVAPALRLARRPCSPRPPPRAAACAACAHSSASSSRRWSAARAT